MTGVTELSEHECRALLRTKSVGRIALHVDGGLRIFPLSYVLDGDAIVFRTLPYGAIAQVAYGNEVAFEVDDLDEEDHTGWSVLALGRCRRIEDADDVQALRAGNDPEPWVGGSRSLYYRIDVTGITGRQVGERSRTAGVPATGVVPEQQRSTATGSAKGTRRG
jgi:nitroimidazol reductase NimA-like FMN-containing flavoprotein (pyridoxamine 5'-phosphate oxidase superfamily)